MSSEDVFTGLDDTGEPAKGAATQASPRGTDPLPIDVPAREDLLAAGLTGFPLMIGIALPAPLLVQFAAIFMGLGLLATGVARVTPLDPTVAGRPTAYFAGAFAGLAIAGFAIASTTAYAMLSPAALLAQAGGLVSLYILQ